MDKQQSEYFEIDIWRLLNAIMRRLWAIILVAALCAGIAFTYAMFFVSPTYTASTLMYVNSNSLSLGATQFSLTSSELSTAEKLVETYLVILKSRKTLNEVNDALELDYSYAQLSGMISAAQVNGTAVFSIMVSSSDPKEAEMIANKIAEILPDKIADIITGTSARVVDYAVVPTSKAAPSITKYTAIGFVIGVVISCLWIVVVEILDDLIHDADSLPEFENMPVLAEIPDFYISSDGGYKYKKYESYRRYGYGRYAQYGAYNSYGGQSDNNNGGEEK